MQTLLNELAVSIARTEAKVDLVLERQVEMKETVSVNSGRIQALETTHSKVKGFLLTISGLGVLAGIWSSVHDFFR